MPDPVESPGPPPKRSPLRLEGVRRSQFILTGSFMTRVLIALGITTVVGRVLPEADFGFYTLVGTLYFVAHVLLDLGTGSVAVREIARSPDRERPLLEGLMGARRVAGAVLALPVIGLGVIETEPLRRWVLFGVAATLPLQAPGALSAALLVRQAQGGPAISGIVTQVLVLLGCLLFAASDVPGPHFAWLLAGREMVNMGVLYLLGRRHLGPALNAGLRGRGLPGFLRMALVQGSAVLLQAAYFHVDVFLVRQILGEASLGSYAAAYRPVTPFLLLPGLIMGPMLPVLSAHARRDQESFHTEIRRAIALLFGLGALGAVAGSILAPELLTLLYGGRFQSPPSDATSALRWMSAAVFCVFAASPLTTGLLAVGAEKTLVILGALALLFNVGANVWLLPRFGFTAAAFVTAVTEATVLGGAALALVRRSGSGLFGRETARALGPAAALALVLGIMPGPAVARVLAGIFGGLAGLWVLLRRPRTQSGMLRVR